MKSLNIPNRERLKGQNIVCRKCGNKYCSVKKENTTKWLCKSNDKPLTKCPSPESQKYISILYNPFSGQSDIKIRHKTRDFWEFRRLHNNLLDIEREIRLLYKEGKLQEARNLVNSFKSTKKELPNTTSKKQVNSKEPSNKKSVVEVLISKDTYLEDAMTIYIEFLYGKRGWDYEERPENKVTIRNYSRALERFHDTLRKNGYNPRIIALSAINKQHLHCYIQEIKDAYTNPSTIKHYLDDVSTFFGWCEKRGSENICNIIDNVKRNKTKGDKTIADMHDFAQMIALVTPENGKGIESWINSKTGKKMIKTKNYYRYWLVNGYWLSLLLGGRGDDIVNMRWDEIKSKTTIEGTTSYWVEHRDHKFKKAEKIHRELPTPMYKQTYEIFLKMGLKEKIGSDDYILAPEVENRTNMKNIMGNSFRWFWREKGGFDPKVKYKSLRSTFITLANKLEGENYKYIQKHSNIETAKKHYLDQTLIVSEMFEKDFYNLKIA